MKLKYVLISMLCLLAACSVTPDHPKPAAEVKPTVRLTLLPENTLKAGKRVTVLAKLDNIKQRTIVTADQLETVHTQKIQLLLIDPTLTDYQRIYPQPTSTPGVYSFTFTPKLPGGYRAWADITPVGGKRQFPMSEELGGSRLGEINRTESREADVGGYHFALSFDTPPAAGGESMGRISITDRDDNPLVSPEPIEIAGFYDNFRTVIHLYATDKEPLTFHFAPPKSGFMKLFVRVRIGGKELSVPFGVRVGKIQEQ